MAKTKEEKFEEDNSGDQEHILESRIINSFTFHVDFMVDIPLDQIKDFMRDLTKFKIKWSG